MPTARERAWLKDKSSAMLNVEQMAVCNGARCVVCADWAGNDWGDIKTCNGCGRMYRRVGQVWVLLLSEDEIDLLLVAQRLYNEHREEEVFAVIKKKERKAALLLSVMGV